MDRSTYKQRFVVPNKHILILLLTAISTCCFSGCGSGMPLGKSSLTALVQVELPSNPVTIGQPIPLTATVVTSGAPPTGTVQFFDNDVALGNRSLDDHGNALLTVTATTAGAHTFMASYAGSNGYAPSHSAGVVLMVLGATIVQPTTTNIAITPASAHIGQEINVTGTVQSTAQVPAATIGIYDGQGLLGTVPSGLDGTFSFRVTMHVSGTHLMSAQYYGDSSHGPSTSSPVPLNITPTFIPTSLSLSAGSSAETPDGSTVLTAKLSASSGIPLGAVQFFDGSSLLATQTIDSVGSAMITMSFAVGTHSLYAVYGGSNEFQSCRSLMLILEIKARTPGEQAFQADAFVDSIGVNTHLSYTDTPYFTSWPGVLTKLQRSGIRHIRDGFYNWTHEPFVAEHQALARAGIRCDYIIPINSTTTAGIISSFAERVADMEEIEGPNECDAGSNCGGAGVNGVHAAVAFMPTIYEAGAALHIPVIGPSFTLANSYATAGNLGSAINYNNVHVYFGGRNPGSQGWGDADMQGHHYGSFDWWEDQAQLDAPEIPIVITEAGYLSLASPQPYTIPESLGASYLPRLLLLAFNKGIKRTYMYELLDEVSSPGYGLLRADLSEKPAFTAITSLVTEVADPGSQFTPASLAYTIKGANSSLQHTLLQKRDGSFILILWSETSNSDPAQGSLLPNPQQSVALSFGGTQKIVEVDRIDESGNLLRDSASSQQSTLMIDGAITLVKIREM